MLGALLFFLAAAAFGQIFGSISTVQPAQQSQPQQTPAPAVAPEDRCTIEGQVINAITGEPLKKANLMLMRADSPGSRYSAVSDAGGKFSIHDIDPGKYHLTAERNGFVRQSYNARGASMAGQILTLSARDKLTGLAFKLMPQSVISGHVIDEDGDPVARVVVEALQYRYMQGKKQLMPWSTATTNDLGEYRIFGLKAEKYFLRATYRDMGMGMSTTGARPSTPAEEGYAPVYYPGASDVSNASPLTLAPGMEARGTDVRLVKTRAVRIRGVVVSPDGRARQGMMVMLLPRSEAMMFSRMMAPTQDPQGHFEIHGVTPGSYVLVANSFGDGLRYTGQQAIEVGNSNIDDVQITLAAPIDLTAHVKVEGNAQVQLNEVSVFLNPVFQTGMGNGFGAVNADGDVTLRNLAPAEYRPQVRTPKGFYVKSIRYGDTDALDSTIDLSSGAPGQLEILLSPDGGEVDGSVTNDKGEASTGAMVTLIPEGERRASMFFKTGTTDQSGHFTMKDIAPGEYTVYAWDEVDYGAVQDPDFLKPFEDQGKKLKIDVKGRENVDLHMIPAKSSNQQ